jgi:hypothetical protein
MYIVQSTLCNNTVSRPGSKLEYVLNMYMEMHGHWTRVSGSIINTFKEPRNRFHEQMQPGGPVRRLYSIPIRFLALIDYVLKLQLRRNGECVCLHGRR